MAFGAVVGLATAVSAAVLAVVLALWLYLGAAYPLYDYLQRPVPLLFVCVCGRGGGGVLLSCACLLVRASRVGLRLLSERERRVGNQRETTLFISSVMEPWMQPYTDFFGATVLLPHPTPLLWP